MIEQDEKKIGQVLVNLIDNAIKYTSIGSIRVTVKLLSNRQLDDLHSIESVESLEEDSTNPKQSKHLYLPKQNVHSKI